MRLGDLERTCKLRLCRNWAIIAAFTWKECGKNPGISCTCRDSNWWCPKSVIPEVFLLGRAAGRAFRYGIQIVTRNVNTPLHSSVTWHTGFGGSCVILILSVGNCIYKRKTLTSLLKDPSDEWREQTVACHFQDMQRPVECTGVAMTCGSFPPLLD